MPMLLSDNHARLMMHRTGKYKMINLIFGFFPFIGASLILMMQEDSGPLQLWLSIVRSLSHLPAPGG